jgi:transcriptional regulator with XRE-family HTH domain
MASPSGGTDRVSTKTKLAAELKVLGEVLVSVREKRGLKQTEVAARLGLPASHLAKVEKGTRRLDVIELIHLAKALEIDPAELIQQLKEALMSRDAQCASGTLL